MWKTRVLLENKFKVQFSNYQQAQKMLHLILLFSEILSIIVALTVEIKFSYLKDTWEFFGRSFVT